jgi:hypothetical protein
MIENAASISWMEERYSSYERSRIAITHVQLQHVDRILQGRGARCANEFLRVLDERTPIRGFFKWRWDTWARTTGCSPESIAHDRDCFLERLSETLVTMYANGEGPDWHTRMTAFLQDKHEALDRTFGPYEEQYRRNTQDWRTFGTIQVAPPQPIQVLFGRYPMLIAALGEHGLLPETRAIQIHVPTRFTQSGDVPWEPGGLVLQLARHLRTVEREYAALGIPVLFGLSWQFDSVLGRRLGFTVVDSPDLPQHIMGAWYQIMNEDGTFNKKRLAHLLEHNELPYRLKCGFRRIDCAANKSFEHPNN